MYTGCNLKTAKLLDCALIGVNAVIVRIRYVKFCNTSKKGLFLKETFSSPWSKTLPLRVVSFSEGIWKTCLVMAFAVRVQSC